MKQSVTADEILNTIEFELAQSAIAHTDLSEGFSAVRQFQNKARSETFVSGRALADTRTLVNRQYQINDMHLTLLHQIALAIHALQLDVRRLRQLPPRAAAPTETASGGESVTHSATPRAAVPSTLDWSLTEAAPEWAAEPIENSMKSDALKIKLDVRPSTTPIIGGLIRRLRTAFHDLTLFYLNQLAQKQTAINQVYGERLLQMSQLVAQQQQQIDMLQAQVAASADKSRDS
jgi:hypothetical protein